MSSLHEVDALLAGWRSKLQVVTENLVAFDSSSGYKMLKGDAKSPPATLTGKTLEIVGSALGEMDGIWDLYQKLNQAITQAEELRAALPKLFNGKQLDELYEFLTGQSIKLPPVEIPLDQRTLTGPSQRIDALSLQEVFDQMQAKFQPGARAVVSYEKAWNELMEKLAAAYDKVEAFKDKNAAIEAALRAKLDSLRSYINGDPIGGMEKFRQEVAPAFAEAATVVGEITCAHQRLEELRQKFSPLVPELATRLDSLDAQVAAGQWGSVRAGLKGWFRQAEGLPPTIANMYSDLNRWGRQLIEELAKPAPAPAPQPGSPLQTPPPAPPSQPEANARLVYVPDLGRHVPIESLSPLERLIHFGSAGPPQPQDRKSLDPRLSAVLASISAKPPPSAIETLINSGPAAIPGTSKPKDPPAASQQQQPTRPAVPPHNQIEDWLAGNTIVPSPQPSSTPTKEAEKPKATLKVEELVNGPPHTKPPDKDKAAPSQSIKDLFS